MFICIELDDCTVIQLPCILRLFGPTVLPKGFRFWLSLTGFGLQAKASRVAWSKDVLEKSPNFLWFDCTSFSLSKVSIFCYWLIMLPASWACGFPAHLGVPGWGSGAIYRSVFISMSVILTYHNCVTKRWIGLNNWTQVYGGAAWFPALWHWHWTCGSTVVATSLRSWQRHSCGCSWTMVKTPPRWAKQLVQREIK